jgi:hypothetical protein
MGFSNQIIQNGNTTLGWVTSGGDTTDHDVIVPKLDNGSSGIRISDVMLSLNPTRYDYNITVVGPEAVAWRAATSRIG